jgi:pimeloyl-ACP methyl ester carboxylesterase
MTGSRAASARTIKTSHGNMSVIDTRDGGPTLLLIHANSLCKEVYLPLIEALAGRYRLIAIDLPGHGHSADAVNPRRTYSLAGYADCAAEVLDALEVARAAVLGWSLGGNVAFEMTRRYPGLTGAMAICASPFARDPNGGLEGFLPNPRLGLSGAAELTEAEIDEFVTLVSDFDVPPEPFWRAAVARTDPRARQFMFEAVLADADGQRQLAEDCKVPLALVVGGDDAFVDIAYLRRLRCANLWSGSVQVLDGLGHAPHIHAPERFNPLLGRFLEDLG